MAEKVKRIKKKLRSPSAFTVLFVVIACMAALTWLIPSGAYDTKPDPSDSNKEIRIAGTYKQVEKVQTEVDDQGKEVTTDSRQGLWDAFVAPINGMAEKLDVIVFVLILGGFLGVTMKTGALDATLGAMLKSMKGNEKWLIPILMTFFAIGGTTYGMQEEAVAFYALVVPIMMAAGYNAMTAVMVIVLGGGVGVLGSTINPFSTGIAASSADVKLGGILGVQAVILVLCLAAAIAFTMRYAAKVKAGGYKDDVRYKPATTTLDMSNVPKMTGPRKAVMAVFGITFLLMIISLIPWGDFKVDFFQDLHTEIAKLPFIGAFFGAIHLVPFGEWYFNEISTLFLISTLVIAAIYYREFQKENVFVVDTFLKGTADLLSVALIIAVATGVSVVMTAGGIQDTIIHWGEDLLRGAGGGVIGIIAFLFYLPMTFIIPSSSGLAAATMPVLAPVADLVGAQKEIIVVAFATASGLLNMIAPTIASLMGGLALAGVSYRAWLKRTAPIMAIFTVICLAVIAVYGALL
ncbi:MAG: YfcC family protein [Candidatus Saccharibacteria bacterium]|nr:YfcC family protein [Candidatus Saccharibacteria bacterium]